MGKINKSTDDFLPQAEKESQARQVYTVTQLTQDIKIILESAFGQVWVEGEVSNFQAAPSGHYYFTLKDDLAILPAAMFGRANKELKFKIENGLKVICFGKISSYGPRGQYQIIAEKMEPKGIGGLQLALEELKKKLEKEGLFAAAHKRPIPYLPVKIGVVTSASGAAIRDILKVLDRRFRGVEIVISPAQVQGELAKSEISQAIQDLNLLNEQLPAGERIEVMIVGRGGGSMEDLWAFNEEIVARAIYGSKIPVISAVGHERDWTVADLVADLRAPTPSVAAELVIPRKEDLRQKVSEVSADLKRAFLAIIDNAESMLDDFFYRLRLGMEHALKLNGSRYELLQKKLFLLNPAALVQQHKLKIIDLARQIHLRLQHAIQLKEARYRKAMEKLAGLSPLNILNRGYSITFKMPELAVVKSSESIKSGDTIKTKLHRGEIISQVLEVKENGGDKI